MVSIVYSWKHHIEISLPSRICSLRNNSVCVCLCVCDIERERNEEEEATVTSIWIHYNSKELKKLCILHSFVFHVIIFPLIRARKNTKRKKVAVAQRREHHKKWRARAGIKGLSQSSRSLLSDMPSLWDSLLCISPRGWNKSPFCREAYPL